MKANDRSDDAKRAQSEVTLDHLGIAVRSLADAVKFYEGVLGLKVSGYEEIPQEQTRVAMLPVGDTRIELLEPMEPQQPHEPHLPQEPKEAGSPIARFLERRGPGLHHICLRVPDLEAAIARLQQNGVRLVSATPGVGAGAGGHRYIFIHPSATGGVLLELVQG